MFRMLGSSSRRCVTSCTRIPMPGSAKPPDKCSLRVHPGSFAGLTELSQHEADGREAQECERLAVQAFPILSQSTASVEPRDGPFDNPTLLEHHKALCGIRTLDDLHVDLAHDPA